MPLSADAFQAASRPRRAECTVAKLLVELDAKDRAVLETVLAHPDVTHSAIEQVLASEGHVIAANTVARHRKGGCACGR